MAEQGRKKVGILFVHGVGEQKRFEHLTGSVLQFAELMRRADTKASVSIIDRTKDWKHDPGAPCKTSGAPVTLRVTSDNCHSDFECHEVWWADLGSRSGIGDAILFWIWGLGQWCAPIYRELDASQTDKSDRTHFSRPVPEIAKTPSSLAGSWAEPRARLQLLLAALGAVTIGLTWGLAKRLLATVLDQAPSATIIVQYLGDVRTYEERAAPGDTALTDPGFPRRVGIRRRMVTEMVAMADRGYDEWYVAAHSLGTVVAYNGLTEIGHTLPNYLPRQQWQALSARFKSDGGCMLRNDVEAMMPSRPPWLGPFDVINRPLLFRNLKGFLTYGSPLNKFAALWPRVIATATDRKPGNSPWPFTHDCRWINLAAPSDPVAGVLDRFSNEPGKLFENALPTIENVVTPWTPLYGLAHILYFTGMERFKTDAATVQKQRTMKWLMGLWGEPIGQRPRSWLTIRLQGDVAYVAIVIALLSCTAVVVTLAGGLLSGLFGGKGLAHFSDLRAFVHTLCSTFPSLVALLLWLILVSGLWRWFRESSLNLALAEVDAVADLATFGTRAKEVWRQLIDMLAQQKAASGVLLAGFVLGGLEFVAFRWREGFSGVLIAIALAGFPFAIGAQTLINRLIKPLEKKPDSDGVVVKASTVDERPLLQGNLP